MTEKIIKRLETPDIELPDSIATENEEFLRHFYLELDGGKLNNIEPAYGHALSTLAHSTILNANLSSDEQNKLLRAQAIKLIEKFGEAIIPFLRDDLRIALDDSSR